MLSTITIRLSTSGTLGKAQGLLQDEECIFQPLRHSMRMEWEEKSQGPVQGWCVEGLPTALFVFLGCSNIAQWLIAWPHSVQYFINEVARHMIMNSMKLVIPLHSLYWSIHTKDESKRGTAFTFIFGVNWLWFCGVTASFGASFHEMKCNGMTSFMEFMLEASKC